MVKISVINQKGGVGKSTISIAMCSIISSMKKNNDEMYKVLLIDLDHQGSASKAIGFEEGLEKTIYEVFTDENKLKECILKSNYGFDVIVSDIRFANAELEIANKISRETILRKEFKNIKEKYDFVILDLPPSLGLVSINGLVASDYVMVPLDIGTLSLVGIEQLLNVINVIKENELNINLEILGILLNKADDRTKLTQKMKTNLDELFGDKVFKTVIHQNVKVMESQEEQIPIDKYAPSSRVTKEFKALVEEVINRVNV